MQLLGVLPNRNMRLPLVPAAGEIVAQLRSELVGAGLLSDAAAGGGAA
jgi:hypothetical protein